MFNHIKNNKDQWNCTSNIPRFYKQESVAKAFIEFLDKLYTIVLDREKVKIPDTILPVFKPFFVVISKDIINFNIDYEIPQYTGYYTERLYATPGATCDQEFLTENVQKTWKCAIRNLQRIVCERNRCVPYTELDMNIVRILKKCNIIYKIGKDNTGNKDCMKSIKGLNSTNTGTFQSYCDYIQKFNEEVYTVHNKFLKLKMDMYIYDSIQKYKDTQNKSATNLTEKCGFIFKRADVQVPIYEKYRAPLVYILAQFKSFVDSLKTQELDDSPKIAKCKKDLFERFVYVVGLDNEEYFEDKLCSFLLQTCEARGDVSINNFFYGVQFLIDVDTSNMEKETVYYNRLGSFKNAGNYVNDLTCYSKGNIPDPTVLKRQPTGNQKGGSPTFFRRDLIIMAIDSYYNFVVNDAIPKMISATIDDVIESIIAKLPKDSTIRKYVDNKTPDNIKNLTDCMVKTINLILENTNDSKIQRKYNIDTTSQQYTIDMESINNMHTNIVDKITMLQVIWSYVTQLSVILKKLSKFIDDCYGDVDEIYNPKNFKLFKIYLDQMNASKVAAQSRLGSINKTKNSLNKNANVAAEFRKNANVAAEEFMDTLKKMEYCIRRQVLVNLLLDLFVDNNLVKTLAVFVNSNLLSVETFKFDFKSTPYKIPPSLYLTIAGSMLENQVPIFIATQTAADIKEGLIAFVKDKNLTAVDNNSIISTIDNLFNDGLNKVLQISEDSLKNSPILKTRLDFLKNTIEKSIRGSYGGRAKRTVKATS